LSLVGCHEVAHTSGATEIVPGNKLVLVDSSSFDPTLDPVRVMMFPTQTRLANSGERVGPSALFGRLFVVAQLQSYLLVIIVRTFNVNCRLIDISSRLTLASDFPICWNSKRVPHHVSPRGEYSTLVFACRFLKRLCDWIFG